MSTSPDIPIASLVPGSVTESIGIPPVDAAGCERVAKHSEVVSFTILELHAGAGRGMHNDDRLLLHEALAQNFHYPRWLMNDLV